MSISKKRTNINDVSVIQDKIICCEKMISNLKHLSSDSAKSSLIKCLDDLKNAELKISLYKNSFRFKYFRRLFRREYNNINNNYISSFKQLRNLVASNLSILDCSIYFDDIKKQFSISNFQGETSDISKHKFYLDVLRYKTYDGRLFPKVNVLQYSVCADSLEKYFYEIDCLLENKKEEVLMLTDLMIDAWGKKLPEDVVSSLKTVVKIFNLSELSYESLLKLSKKTCDDLKNLEARVKDIESRVDVLCKDSKCVNKLCEETFINGDKDAFKKLCKQLGVQVFDTKLKATNITDTDLKTQVVNLFIAKEQFESKENDLLLLNSHLSKVIDNVPVNSPVLELYQNRTAL